VRKLWPWFLPVLALAQMGSPGDGHTQAIALDPRDPKILYAGAGKGLCRQVLGSGDNWPAIGLETRGPRAVVIHPRDPGVVFAGTYEMGVYKRGGEGKPFVPVNSGLGGMRIRALVMDPADPDVLYAGADGEGVFRTADGGGSWQEKNRGLIDKTIRALAIDPRDSSRLYAATWHGVYLSEDRGEHWAPTSLYDVDVAALAIAPSNPDVLYAATNPRGVWSSRDRGRTWVQGEKVLAETLMSIAVDLSDANVVFAGTKAGVFRSTDGARTFSRAGLAWSNAAWTLVFDPRTTPPTLYYGGEGGVLKTTDQGRWWDITGLRRQ